LSGGTTQKEEKEIFGGLFKHAAFLAVSF